MSKKCSVDGCQGNVFGGGYCAYHQYIRRMKGGDLYKPKPRKVSKIPKESKKRKQDNKRYLERLKERWEEAVKNGTNICVFCNKKMTQREDNHHVSGRDVTILDESAWAWAHRECHSQYHDAPVKLLLQTDWYLDFVERLQKLDMSTYFKEKRRIDKSNGI